MATVGNTAITVVQAGEKVIATTLGLRDFSRSKAPVSWEMVVLQSRFR